MPDQLLPAGIIMRLPGAPVTPRAALLLLPLLLPRSPAPAFSCSTCAPHSSTASAGAVAMSGLRKRRTVTLNPGVASPAAAIVLLSATSRPLSSASSCLCTNELRSLVAHRPGTVFSAPLLGTRSTWPRSSACACEHHMRHMLAMRHAHTRMCMHACITLYTARTLRTCMLRTASPPVLLQRLCPTLALAARPPTVAAAAAAVVAAVAADARCLTSCAVVSCRRCSVAVQRLRAESGVPGDGQSGAPGDAHIGGSCTGGGSTDIAPTA